MFDGDRAKETLERVGTRLKPAKVLFERGIYEVPERKLWKRVRIARGGEVRAHGLVILMQTTRGEHSG